MDLEDIVSPGLDADILRPAPTHLEGLAGAIGRRIAQFLARRIHSIIDCELERLALDASFGDQSGLNALVDSLVRSEEHTSELQSLMRISYGVCCLKKTNNSTCRINTTVRCSLHTDCENNEHSVLH